MTNHEVQTSDDEPQVNGFNGHEKDMLPQERYFSLEADKFEQMTTTQSPVELLSFSPISQNSAEGMSPNSPGSWPIRPVQDWDTQQVSLWLIGKEFEHLVTDFANRNIDGKQLLALDNSKLKTMGLCQNDRSQLKKKIKDLKTENEREEKARKQREKDIKSGKKEVKGKDMLGFIKKGKYTLTTP
ncbi:predicted protein [Nematostella vectensis]|uniref:SAM domain-containing protein n=1 Tax=Nematostella vectensis TaxID=45351 RepID=A7T481_NEMVE|nr:predicted protein [Nematostella vectensis]|eukprot:XP_001621332.1 hypothetical protein NEMVEDRAFT_v1g222094 [Nematostella vectensis]